MPSLTGYATGHNNGANCNPAPSISYTDQIVSTGSCGDQTINRTWQAADAGTGLNVNCVQVITLADNTPPVLVNVPNDIIVTGTGAGCGAIVKWTEPNAIDNCSVLSSGCQYVNGSVFPQGVYQVIYTAEDHCGNIGTATFTITVVCQSCNTAPTLSCPANYVACVGSGIDPSITGYATGTNNGANCGTPTVTYTDNVVSTGPCAGAKVIQREWLATDPASGLTGQCSQNITLQDVTAPTITGIPSDITISATGPNCTAIATWTDAVASDNCGIDTYVCDYNSGDSFVQGVTTITCTATDLCGNQTVKTFTVTVNCEVCMAVPFITCPDDYVGCPDLTIPDPIVAGEAIAVAGETTCLAPVLTYADVVVSTGTCANAQTIERTWTATDTQDATLTASCVQIITLEDLTAPVITSCPAGFILQGTIVTTGGGGGGGGTGSGTGSGTPGGPGGGGGATSVCQAIATWTAPNVLDGCSGITLVAVDQNGAPVASGDTFPEGTTTITYTATDDCGNVATCSFDVIVSCSDICDIPPIAVCPDDVTICLGSDFTTDVTGNATYVAFPLCIDLSLIHI